MYDASLQLARIGKGDHCIRRTRLQDVAVTIKQQLAKASVALALVTRLDGGMLLKCFLFWGGIEDFHES